MPPKRPTHGIKRQIDRELRHVERERDRLLAARAALEGQAVAKDKPKRFSQDDVAEYLAANPGSSYTQIAEGLGAPAINIAAHLRRGRMADRFESRDGKWHLKR